MPDPHIAVDDHLALRAFRLDDVPALFEAVAANRPHLGNWLEWADAWTSFDRPRAFIERARAGYEQGTGLELAMDLDGRLVGAAGISGIDLRAGSGEIGYWVAEREQGRGLVTRSCRALVAHATHELGLRHLVIRVATENARSRAVADRLGFSLMAIRAGVDPPEHGRSGDEAVYVLSGGGPGARPSR
jgi:ribosomal-protein-serine acetyltransferase